MRFQAFQENFLMSCILIKKRVILIEYLVATEMYVDFL
jgi:hypothetical protein